jgi:DNA mismatch endonuclease, patch repair protein
VPEAPAAAWRLSGFGFNGPVVPTRTHALNSEANLAASRRSLGRERWRSAQRNGLWADALPYRAHQPICRRTLARCSCAPLNRVDSLADPPVDPARSALMRRVAQRGSKPEMVVRRALQAAGYRFRLHRKDLPGSPDIVFPARRAAVFVHGCFWHRHRACRAASTPKIRADFWSAKFAANIERDQRVAEALHRQGWSVHVVWECETRRGNFLPALLTFLEGSEPGFSSLACAPPRNVDAARRGGKRRHLDSDRWSNG